MGSGCSVELASNLPPAAVVSRHVKSENYWRAMRPVPGSCLRLQTLNSVGFYLRYRNSTISAPKIGSDSNRSAGRKDCIATIGTHQQSPPEFLTFWFLACGLTFLPFPQHIADPNATLIDRQIGPEAMSEMLHLGEPTSARKAKPGADKTLCCMRPRLVYPRS